MIRTGSTVVISVRRQTAAGAASTGKVLADFAYEFRLNGVVQSITPTVTEGATTGTWREYHFSFTAPSSTGALDFFIVATNTDILAANTYTDDVVVSDTDTLAGLFVSSTVAPVSPVATQTTRTVFQGDTLRLDFVVLESTLSAIGAASLAAVDTLAIGMKLDSNDSGDAQDATLTATVLSDTSGNRVVRGTLAFPAAFNVPDGQRQIAATAMLRLTEGSVTVIGAIVNVQVLWKATTA
jgi:hypothetical protein